MSYLIKSNLIKANCFSNGKTVKKNTNNDNVLKSQLIVCNNISDGTDIVSFNDLPDDTNDDNSDNNEDEQEETLYNIQNIQIDYTLAKTSTTQDVLSKQNGTLIYSETESKLLISDRISLEDNESDYNKYLVIGCSVKKENDVWVIRMYKLIQPVLSTYVVEAGERFYYVYKKYDSEEYVKGTMNYIGFALSQDDTDIVTESINYYVQSDSDENDLSSYLCSILQLSTKSISF